MMKINQMSNKAKILIDADVLIHLFKAGRVSILGELFKDRLIMLDIVLNELRSNRTINSNLNSIFLFSGIKEIEFPTTSKLDMFKEYVSLEKQINGKGERATLVYCKYNEEIIASSNTKDITPFCDEFGIPFLTTLDILCIAESKGKISKKEGNSMIKSILTKGSFLCCDNIDKHLTNHFVKDKILY